MRNYLGMVKEKGKKVYFTETGPRIVLLTKYPISHPN